MGINYDPMQLGNPLTIPKKAQEMFERPEFPSCLKCQQICNEDGLLQRRQTMSDVIGVESKQDELRAGKVSVKAKHEKSYLT